MTRKLRLRAPVTLCVGALLLTSCLDSCRKDPVDGPAPLAPDAIIESGPPAMSPGTLRALGPHVWEASLDMKGDRAGFWPSREVVSKLVWADIDRSLFEEIAPGRLQREIRVGDDVFRLAQNDGLYRKTHEVGGNTIIQMRTTSLWDQAISGFSRHLAWSKLADDAIDGRAVTVWKLELAPPPALDSTEAVDPSLAASKLGLATRPIALSGTVYVDNSTGNRLLAEVEGRFSASAVVGGRDPTDEVHVTYRERRSIGPVPPDVAAPATEKIFVPRRTRPGGQR